MVGNIALGGCQGPKPGCFGPCVRIFSEGALTSKTSGEGEIRKALVADGNLIDCIVNLLSKLFLNAQIPAALWFMNRARSNGHPRKNEILFIDARNMGHLINRRTRELSHEDIQKIADTYHAWRVGADCIRPDEVDADKLVVALCRPAR